MAVAPRTDLKRRFFSEYAGERVEIGADVTAKQTDGASWINYPLGVLVALPAFQLKVPNGFDYVAVSDLPTGAGLSSSAAIELASGLAFLALTNQHPDRETLVKIGKHAENNFVGVPCRILDQGVSGFGKKDHLVFLDCKGPRFDTVPLTESANFWIFNTHTKHALVDGLYAARYRECMEAAKALGVAQLVDATSAQIVAAKGKLSAEAFKRTKHVVDEIARVDQTVAMLQKSDLHMVGRLLTASHRSSQYLFENSTPELDFLVDHLSLAQNVHGARLTGGGFGGAVMALTSPAFGDAQALAIADAYEQRFWVRPEILHMKTGDGAKQL